VHVVLCLYIYICHLLFSGLPVHGYVPGSMLTSTVIRIPKGKQANKTDSANYL